MPQSKTKTITQNIKPNIQKQTGKLTQITSNKQTYTTCNIQKKYTTLLPAIKHHPNQAIKTKPNSPTQTPNKQTQTINSQTSSAQSLKDKQTTYQSKSKLQHTANQ